jgi:hypothetical protein
LEPCGENVDNHTHQFKICIAGYHPLSDSGEEGAAPGNDVGRRSGRSGGIVKYSIPNGICVPGLGVGDGAI